VSSLLGQVGAKLDKEEGGGLGMAKIGANGCLLRNSRHCDGMVNAESTTGAGILSCIV
jgi:hypothetical protein